MKKQVLITLGLAAFAVASNAQTVMNVVQYDGEIVKFDIDNVKEVNFVEKEVVDEFPDQYFIDLDLPSGTLWAGLNVGAKRTGEFGDFFSWGDTKPQSEFSWSTYKWVTITKETSDSLGFTKYYFGNSCHGVIDNRSKLMANDDAATANWGPKWRMPTKEEFKELREHCTWNWYVSDDGKNTVGFWAIGPQGKGQHIFFPAGGYYYDDKQVDVGHNAIYWTSTLEEGKEYRAYAANCINAHTDEFPNDGYLDLDGKERYHGFLVRAVYYKKRDQLDENGK